MLSVNQTIIWTLVMGAVIFFCRLFPFIFFRATGNEGRGDKFILFVEKTAPPVAMTVLCFNSLASSVRESLPETLLPQNVISIVPLLAASLVTAFLHLWKRNALVSVFSGTVLFMLLSRLAEFY
jgi:branched-subunit amino acid transport protein AzlD